MIKTTVIVKNCLDLIFEGLQRHLKLYLMLFLHYIWSLFPFEQDPERGYAPTPLWCGVVMVAVVRLLGTL